MANIPPVPHQSPVTDDKGFPRPVWADWFNRVRLGAAGGGGTPGEAGPAGPPGSNGPPGLDGATWYEGAGVPSVGTGTDGDFYLNVTNGDVYQKGAGVWTMVGNIKGPAGPTGPAGGADTSGNLDFSLAPVKRWFIAAPDTTLWEVTVDDWGILTTTSGVVGTETLLKVTRPDATEVSFAIDNTGVLSVVEPADGAAVLDDGFLMRSPGNYTWHVGVTNLNEIITDTSATAGKHMRVLGNTGAVLFQIEEIATGKAGVYISLFNAGNLPSPPVAVAGLLPLCFYDNGVNKRLIYHDGSDWRYVADDTVV